MIFLCYEMFYFSPVKNGGLQQENHNLATEYCSVDPIGSAVYGMGLRSLACWDCGFESPPEAWMFVSFEFCVLSGRGPCVGLITRPEESYRVWCI
jgi:hypothetical protein